MPAHPKQEIEATYARYVATRDRIEAGELGWDALADFFTEDATFIDPAWGRVEGIAAVVGGRSVSAETDIILISDVELRARLSLAEQSTSLPLGEIPADEDVAEAAVFFCSERARMITGETLMVNAGELLR